MLQIRQMLSVPETLRAYASKERKSPRKPSFPEGDAWAARRAQELQEQGVCARLRRYRKNEPLCVVYRA
jgi:hypothetical protein